MSFSSIVPLLYYDRKVKTKRYNEYLRDTMDPFNIPDRCFIDNYRLPKSLAIMLIEEIKPFIESDSENPCKIPLFLQVLATLNFFASGSHQRRVGLDAFAIMSQSSISRTITLVSEAIGTKLIKKYVKFPKTQAEANQKKNEFFAKFGVPGIVGLIDCTHIAIANLKKDIEYAYVNRKYFHSINTQAVCDSKMEILTVNARYCGSTHDSHIWDGSKAKTAMQRLNSGDNHTWLLGDSGYALKPYMMVPIRNASTDADQRYNKIHCKIRSGIERCFGLLKSRFRCLKVSSGHLHYTHKRAADIIYSCVVLHNILIKNKYPIEVTDDEPDEVVPTSNAEEVGSSGVENRNFLANYISENISIN